MSDVTIPAEDAVLLANQARLIADRMPESEQWKGENDDLLRSALAIVAALDAAS